MTISSRVAPTMSSVRLEKRDSGENVGWRIESSGIPPTCSIVRAPSRNSNSRGTMSTVTPASRQTRMLCSSSSWLARVNAIITRSTRPKVIRSGSASSVPSRGMPSRPGSLDVVVDVADRVQPDLVVTLQALHELHARRCPSRGSASARAGSGERCRPTRAAARPMPAPAPVMTARAQRAGHGVGRRRARSAGRTPATRSSSAVTARRGASPTPLAHERRSSTA